ncbi:MAG: hypothetical protein M3P18_06190 [Actinomycetota bacterium]|nr:hypothetical protein [Actinomycetota bacterium]
MKVSVVRSGGVAGMTLERAVASDSLPPEEAERLRQRVDSLELPLEPPAKPSRQADRFDYELTITADDGTERHVEGSEEQLPDAVRSLAEWVVRQGDSL